MAVYIDRDLIEWYGCNFEDGSCDSRECSSCAHAECSHTQVMQIPPADVIERSEYEKIIKGDKTLKLKDLKNLFSNYTNVKLVINGQTDVFKGFWINVPAAYADWGVECVIPIRHPDNEKLGMASILIYEDK